MLYYRVDELQSAVLCCAAQLLPSSFRNQSWGLLHGLLEMFTYRQHHVQPHYRIQFLGHLKHLHDLPNIPQIYQNQMFLWWVQDTQFHLKHLYMYAFTYLI